MATNRFDNQKSEARAASLFAKIVDDNGKTAVVTVPGHDSKTYKVILRRDGGTMTAECLLQTSIGDKPCASGDHLCYHSIAAMIKLAAVGKVALSFTKNVDSARRLAHIAKDTARVVVLARHNHVETRVFATAKKEVK